MSTLALNMIVGANEATELKRCLDSFHVKENFDEIIIGVTTGDASVKKTAKEYTDKVIDILWADNTFPYGNFSRARNAVLDVTKSDSVMWLDADDGCLKKHREKFTELCKIVKDEVNASIDAYFVPYAIALDNNYEPMAVFMRERIFKNNGIFRWKNPVHEQFNVRWEDIHTAHIKNFFITHMPSKPQYASATRNVKILDHEYQKNKKMADPQLKYFLARDLLLSGGSDRAYKIFEEMVQKCEGSYENLYLICLDSAFHSAYGAYNFRPAIDGLDLDNLDKIERWLRLALGFSMNYAEPYVMLGDLYMHRGCRKEAEHLYMTALQKKLYEGTMQTATFYEELPAERLANIYTARSEYEKALWYAKRSWLHNKGNKSLLKLRKEITTVILGEIKQYEEI